MRRKAIVIGIVAETLIRVVFALFTTRLLEIIGLLLLWVSWKLWREARLASISVLWTP